MYLYVCMPCLIIKFLAEKTSQFLIKIIQVFYFRYVITNGEREDVNR